MDGEPSGGLVFFWLAAHFGRGADEEKVAAGTCYGGVEPAVEVYG